MNIMQSVQVVMVAKGRNGQVVCVDVDKDKS